MTMWITYVIYFHLHFNVKNDMDIVEWMKEQDNKQDYIRRLIRADIARQARKEKKNEK